METRLDLNPKYLGEDIMVLIRVKVRERVNSKCFGVNRVTSLCIRC